MDGVYLDFIEASATISHRTLLVKLVARGLDGRTLRWVKTKKSRRAGTRALW